MAATLSISVGTLTSSLSTEDTAAATNVLLFFATAIGIPEELEPQQKLDAVVAHLAEFMQGAARERYFQRESAALKEEAEQNVHW